MLRRLAITAVAVLAIAVIALLVLHTNPIQARVLDFSIRQLEQRFDLDLVADDLHYNLAARRVTRAGERRGGGAGRALTECAARSPGNGPADAGTVTA